MLNKQKNKIVRNTLVGVLSLLGGIQAVSAETANISADVGMGYNSNVYHAPSASYVDLAKTAAPTISPNVQGGLFIPMKAKVDYMIADDLKLRYKFDGRFYASSALRAADTSDHTLNVQKSLALDEGLALQVEGFFGMHTKLYVDRDTGTEQLSNAGLNVSNRYTYQDFGIAGQLSKDISGVKIIGKAKYAILNYDEPVVISSLDHTLLQLGGFAQMKWMENKAKLTVGYEYMTRAYDNRRARDLTATLGTNPFLTYTYGTLSGRASYKISDETRIFAGVELISRTDDFVGYNDYTKTKMNIRVLHKLGERTSLRGKLAISNTDYVRAFAFENPGSPIKTSSSTNISLKGKYKWKGYGDPVLWANASYQSVDTNDLRYKYSYTELALGGDWKF